MITTFDKVRGDVLPGAHWVLRVPGVVAVIRRDDADRVPSALVELIQDTAKEVGPTSGRELALRLTRWVIDTADVPSFGTVAGTDDGIAVLLHGDVNLSELSTISGHTRELVHLSGLTAAFTVDRLLPWPERPVALTVGASPATDGRASAGANCQPGLVHGLVPGTGVVLDPGAAATAAGDQHEPQHAPIGSSTHGRDAGVAVAGPFPRCSPPARTSDGNPLPPAQSHPEVAAPSPLPPPHDAAAQLEPPNLSERIHGSGVQNAKRAPLPIIEGQGSGASSPGSSEQPSPVFVDGFHCSRGHLNDPRVAFCSACGIRMSHRTGAPVQGRRPPLGLLVFDTGSIFVLDDDYLLGRRPETHEAVNSGRLRPIQLHDDSGTLSRLHAEIRLQNWEVLLIDLDSANGTHIAGPADTEWTRLAPHQPFVLDAGTNVRIGRRTFIFQSARAEL